MRYGEVVWRFSPAAAPTARQFVFHRRQRIEDLPDGSLEIRFSASGWLEMAWHLYQGRVPWSGVAGDASVRSGMAGPISPARAGR
jgi:hypothetical protein